MIPLEDRRLVRKHGMGLQDYWLDCWEADPYGSRYVLMPDADLKSTTQAKYRKQLEALGLFMFEIRKQGGDRKLWVLNLHGSRVKNFWQPIAESLGGIEKPVEKVKQTLVQIERTLDEIEQIDSTTQAQQDLQNGSISPQHSSTSPQRDVEEKSDQLPLEAALVRAIVTSPPDGHPIDEPVRVADTKVLPEGSPLNSSQELKGENIPPMQTEPPLEEASLTDSGMEEEELPVALDCPTASCGVEEISTQSRASQEEQPEAAGEEQKDPGKDEYSAEAEVGHFEIVEKICQLALDHYCRVTNVEREEMMNFTLRQLEVVSKIFQQYIGKRNPNRNQAFQFAIGLGRRSRPQDLKTWRRT